MPLGLRKSSLQAIRKTGLLLGLKFFTGGNGGLPEGDTPAAGRCGAGLRQP